MQPFKRYRAWAIRLLIILLVLIFCGFGKANEMYFLAVKRTPGFHKTLFHKETASAFGTLFLDDELKANYAFILVSYGPRYGFQFFRRS